MGTLPELRGKVALVTGASRGIGRACAELLAQAGMTVYACARSEEALQALAAACPGVLPYPLDLRDEDAVRALASDLGAAHGKLDLLVNNAGILGPRAALDATGADALRNVLEINVVGAFNVLSACYPVLKAADDARVINLSSSVGRKGRAQWGAYSISKFALEGLSEIAADELGNDAIVVTLNPGGTATDMRAEAYPDEDPTTLPSAQAVAQTILLLARQLRPQHNGGRFSARSLFELAAREPKTPVALPQD
ncbi:YciK family oxidoreductase [Lujinxingia litoralis]|uniref:YciK family oxidoreductase n=1 Tax=Lujinxingia litoralis TaxID=2211119 RepID=A0A328CBP8_9DELT|nr:SDR family oxidoreductase [Lujinxingia litoralis]RAL23557.1 YciK family oxidoreductase [Lujinxingia litoralis]